MGQSPTASLRPATQPRAAGHNHREPMAASIFVTPLGWMGVAGSGTTVVALTMGHASPEEVHSALAARARAHGGAGANGALEERDWYPELRRALDRYARGQFVDFRPFKIDVGRTTEYRKRVLEAARQIPYGQTLSYGELAAKAGKPRAARAVGSAMASNPISLLIPCHRVVAAGGKLGGFSCRTGVELKQRLLEMEAQAARRKSHGKRSWRLL
jgi:methylated-DNA-[protein]-cysteine S-methyltransferase